jgi:tetratricopeptide (TPR) repeat protein
MTDEIASALTRFKSLFIIADGSTQTFKGMTVMPLPQDVARQFAVRYVLEGDVRKDANRVRISVKLRNGADGALIWGERVEDTLENVFALQDKVALGVARAVEPGGRTPETRRGQGHPTNDIVSYDLYLQARALQRKMSKPDVVSALDLAEKAIALDPGFALATALAATCHSVLDRYNWAEDRETHRRQSLALAHRALQLAGDDPEIPALVAYCLGAAEADLAGAIALIDCATTLKPHSALGWRMSGNVRARNGEPDTAVEHLERSIRLNPGAISTRPHRGSGGPVRGGRRPAVGEPHPERVAGGQLWPPWPRKRGARSARAVA